MKPVNCIHCGELIEESTVVKTQAFLTRLVLVLIACPHCRKLDIHAVPIADFAKPGLLVLKSKSPNPKSILKSLLAHQKKHEDFMSNRLD